MPLRRVIDEGEMLPRGYGVAWEDATTYLQGGCFTVVCYPVPLNLLFRWARNSYWFLAHKCLGKLPYPERMIVDRISELEKQNSALVYEVLELTKFDARRLFVGVREVKGGVDAPLQGDPHEPGG